MKVKIAKLGLMSAGALLLASVNAAADDMIRRETTTTTERVAPLPDQPIESESYRRRTHTDPINGTVVEERTDKRDLDGSRSTTTTVTQNNYTGVVRQIEPSRTVMIVNGMQYDIRGPMASELSSHVGQNVTVIGRLDQPARTIEIERWESSN